MTPMPGPPGALGAATPAPVAGAMPRPAGAVAPGTPAPVGVPLPPPS